MTMTERVFKHVLKTFTCRLNINHDFRYLCQHWISLYFHYYIILGKTSKSAEVLHN